MLSVLLLILKIILLTIAILLGIIILLLLSLLFLPFCYQFYGKYENEGYMEGSIRWILFVIHFKTSYEHEELTYDLKSFGYTIYSNREDWQRKHNTKTAKKFSFFKKDKEETANWQNETKKDASWKEKKKGFSLKKQRKETESSLTEKENKADNSLIEKKNEAEIPLTERKIGFPEEQTGERNVNQEKTNKKALKKSRNSILSSCAAMLETLRSVLKKIWSLFAYFFYFPWKVKEKILLGIEKAAGIWFKIKPLFHKLDLWMKLLKQKSTKEAIKHLKNHLKFLWKGIKPRKFFGELHFGFEEPEKTGKMLGLIGCGYGLYRNHIKIIPYFNEKILKGSFYGKGRIQVFHLIRTGLFVYKDKLLMKKWEQIQKLMEQ